MNTLSLTLIVKNEEKHIDRVLETAKIYADEIVIVDTGSTDNTVELAKKYTDNIYHFDWCDDFAKARNFGIEKCTKDFILWLDADDIIPREDAENLRKLMDNDISWDIGYLPYHIEYDENGNTTLLYNRERLFRNNKGIYFKYPVHECLDFPQGLIYQQEIGGINVYHKNIHRWQSSSDRNLRILLKTIELPEYRNDSRIWQQLGIEYKYRNEPVKSILYMEHAVTLGHYDTFYIASQYYDLGAQYSKLKDFVKAKYNFRKAIDTFSQLKESYFELGKISFELGEFQEALEMFLLSLNTENTSRSRLDNSVYQGPLLYDWLSVAYDRVWNYEKALEYANKVLELTPDNERVLKNKNMFEHYVANIARGKNLKKIDCFINNNIDCSNLKIAIVTQYTDNIENYARFVIDINKRYADKYGYGFIVNKGRNLFSEQDGRYITWDKVKIMEEHLSGYDYLFWLDVDAMITNHDIRLEQFITDKNLIICKDDANSFKENTINTGSFFVKNNEYSINLIKIWWQVADECGLKYVFPAEQGALQYIYEKNIENLKDNITLYPETVFNSCMPAHLSHNDQQFVLHMMAIDNKIREEIFQKYYNNIIQKYEYIQ